MITIIGNHVSPYVRKVLAALELKRVPYRVDPIVPFLGNERFEALSPLRRVPVLVQAGEHGELVLPDSTVICEYLDEAYPGARLLPADPEPRARARWIEEFADSRLGDVIVWRLFFKALVGPRVLGLAKDEAALAQTLGQELPAALTQVEAMLPSRAFLFGDEPMTCDFAVGAMLQMLAMVRQPIDAGRFPKCAAFEAAVSAHPAMSPLLTVAGLIMATKPADQLAALAAAGVNVVGPDETMAGAVPRPRVSGGT